MTIHNLAFQGLFERAALHEVGLPESAWTIDGVEFHGQLSFLKAGLQRADAITTVSPGYAKEILTDEAGMGLAGLLRYRKDSLHGILNAIDTEEWNPATDTRIAARYDRDSLDRKALNKAALQRELGLARDDTVPLLGVVSRLTHQKGLDLVPPIADALAALPVQLAALGSGAAEQEHDFIALAKAHPGRFAVHLGFDEGLAHRIEAGADIFLMPSRFEPCGLSQMHSLRYGTPPVVRATGGLGDTVVNCNDTALKSGRANGFVFQTATAAALLTAIRRAVATWHQPVRWRQLQSNGMARDFGWAKPAQKLVKLYAGLVRRA
jgi:starch synthase